MSRENALKAVERMNNAIGPRDLSRIAKALEGIGKTLERIEKRVRKQRPVIIRCRYNLNESDFERWAEKIESTNENLVCIPASAEVVTEETVPVREVTPKEFKVDTAPDNWEPKILGKDQNCKKIYIAGPITGVEGYLENFKRAEKILRGAGYEPVNPTAPGEVDGADYRYYINRGLRLLEECDGIAMLPGFTDSPGARLEHRYAVTVGLPIMGIDLDGSGGVLGAI